MHVNQKQVIKPSAAFSSGPKACLTGRNRFPKNIKTMSAISCSQYFWFYIWCLPTISMNGNWNTGSCGILCSAWCPNYQHIMLLSAIVYQNNFLISACPQIKLVLIIAVLLNSVQVEISVTVDEKSMPTSVAKPVGFHHPTETVVSSSRWSAMLGVARCVTCMHTPVSLTLSLCTYRQTPPLNMFLPPCICSFTLLVTPHIEKVFFFLYIYQQQLLLQLRCFCSCQYDVLYSLAMCSVASREQILNV